MSKQSSVPETGTGSRSTDRKSATKLFAKSDWPKTPKETIKMILNLFVNFFS